MGGWQEERRLENMIEQFADKTPPWLAELLRSLAPLMATIVATINVIGPPLVEFYTHLFKVGSGTDWGGKNCGWAGGTGFDSLL